MTTRGTRPHYAGPYARQARAIRAAANNNPDTRCWRCHRTLAEVRQTKPNATWTAGHLIDTLPGGPLAPECEPCNKSAGATLGNKQRQPKPNPSRSW